MLLPEDIRILGFENMVRIHQVTTVMMEEVSLQPVAATGPTHIRFSVLFSRLLQLLVKLYAGPDHPDASL